MKVSVVYAQPNEQQWIQVEVADDALLVDAIHASNILKFCPDINLNQQKVGIFGKITALDYKLKVGDRVEIYRPITWQPEEDDED